MSENYRNFVDGIAVIPKAVSANDTIGEIETIETFISISSISTGTTPTVVTSTAHGLSIGQSIRIVASGTTPDIDGVYTVVSTPLTTSFTIATANITVGSSLVGIIYTNNSGFALYHNGYQNSELVGANFTQTLTEKTLSGNTATNLINGAGTFNFNSSGTITAPNGTDTLAGLTLTQTLTNKTLTSPILNTPTADTITGITGATLLIQSASNENLSLQAQGIGNVLVEGLTFNGTAISNASGSMSVEGFTFNGNAITATGAFTIGDFSFNNSTLSTSSTMDISSSGGNVNVENVAFNSNVISDVSGGLVIQSSSAQGLALNGQGASGYVYLQKSGASVAFIDSDGIYTYAQNKIKLGDANTSNYIGLNAPAVVAGDYTITLPAAAPASNTVLLYNGSDYIWSNGNFISSLTGDVTASGPGAAAATLATVNSNVGSFSNANITVNAKGLITAASSGSVANLPVTTKTTTYTATNSDSVILVDGTSASFTLGLFTASGNTGKVLTIKRIDNTLANTVTVDPNSSETIDGASTYLLELQYQTIQIVSNGTNWNIIDEQIPIVVASVKSSTAVSSSTGTALVIPTVIFDTTSSYNNSTGNYTAPIAGKYSISFTEFEPNVGITDPEIALYKNGSKYHIFGYMDAGSGGNPGGEVAGSSMLVDLAKGDTLFFALSDGTGLYADSATRGPMIHFQRIN